MSGLRAEYLHLDPLKAHELPSHPDLVPSQGSNSTDLDQFITTFLDQGLEFAELKINDTSIFSSDGMKDSHPSTAKVEALIAHHPVFSARPKEHWYARRSIHEDKDENGTATFTDFDLYLRKDHSVHEGKYTPNVFDTNRLIEWPLDGKVLGKYTDIEMNIYEMYHKTPTPIISNRVFNTLVVVARDSDTSFLVVQSPVDLTTFPAKLLKRRSHRSQHGGVVEGLYTSVERAKLTGADDAKKTEWVTGTASNAAGSLPIQLQRMAFPKALTVDVGFFMKYNDEKRRK